MKTLYLCIGLVCFGIACSNTLDQDVVNSSDTGITKADVMESSQISLWFEGKITDPENLNQIIQQDLKRIRNEASDSLSQIVNKRFQLPWDLGEIVIAFDDSTLQRVRDQDYRVWNNLADSLSPISILREPDEELGIGLFEVKSNYNPIVLSKIYGSLPGIRFAEPNFINHGGGNSFPFYPYPQPNNSRYLFRDNGKLYLFKMKSDDSIEIKFWDRRLNPAPSWWDDINSVYVNFARWSATNSN